MKFLIILLFSQITTDLMACEDGTDSTCIYEKHDMRFSYYDRWHIEEESGWFTHPYVFLETDDSGIIMILILPKEEHKNLEEFATEYSKSANSQIIIGAFESIGFNEITAETKHIGFEEKLTLNIFDEEIPMTRQYFSFSTAQKTAYIILQIDDEEINDINGLEKVLNTFEFLLK